jgi:hypothetical protein
MFEELIAKIGKTLERRSLPYMIIGGQAVLLYGVPRLTKDIDVTLGVGIDKLPEIKEIAKNAKLKPLPKNMEAFVEKTFVLPTQEQKSGARVDFIFSFTPYEKQAIRRGTKVKVKNFQVNFASKEDVIIHKVIAGRPRDIEDMKSMILKNQSFDKKYVKSWLKEFDKSIEGDRFLERFNEILKDLKRNR